MAEDKAAAEPIVVVRRVVAEEDGHHGGVWKIALADFMTALMAFFLIMWLVNATDEETKKAIANYFNPILLADSPTDRKGLADPREVEGPDGPHEGEAGFENRTRTPPDDARRRAATLAAQRMAALERAAYQDPYAVLAELAHLIDPTLPTRPDAPRNVQGVVGRTAADSARDPFDPSYWQTVPTRPALTLRPGEPGTVGRRAADDSVDVRARRPAGADDGASPVEPPSRTGEPATPSEAANGQGERQAIGARETRAGGATAVSADARAESGERIAALARRIARRLDAAGVDAAEVDATPEGVLVSLTDDADFSMFPVGSAVPRPALLDLMGRIADALADVDGAVIVRGHTDGRPFRSETYDNWRLSTARAHMAQYMLVRGGLDDTRITGVEGYADRRLKDPQDPFAAVNRRIEILLAPSDDGGGR